MSTEPGTVNERTILRQLARVQMLRYARHPLFLIGFTVAIAGASWDVVSNPNLDPSRDGGLHFYSAFLLGVLGLIVSYRLTRTEQRALAVLPSAPISSRVRTLALCAACLVPALAAVLVLTVASLGWRLYPPSYLQTLLDAMPAADFAAWILGATAVAGLGGSLLGVVVGRWWRFPGAGAMAAVLVIVLAVAANIFSTEFADSPSVASRAGLVSPWIVWLDLEQIIVDVSDVALIPGSAVGHLVYMIGLCGLAVWAAVIKDAEGVERSRWMRNGAIALVIAVGGLAWAISG